MSSSGSVIRASAINTFRISPVESRLISLFIMLRMPKSETSSRTLSGLPIASAEAFRMLAGVTRPSSRRPLKYLAWSFSASLRIKAECRSKET